MTRSRLFLSVLLCLLVLSWGTSPCVVARALDLPGETSDAAADVKTSSCCCKTKDEAPKDPRDCPCCKRGGSLRDLPPPVAAPELAAAGESAFLALPVGDLPVLKRLDPVAPRRDTSPPPLGNALHARPVGIVLLLS